MSDSESEDEEILDYLDPDKVADEVISRDFEAEKRAIMADQLPKKSRAAYELAYAKFLKYMHGHKVADITEALLVVYFEELKEKFKPTTLWSTWSKLRTTISLRHRININQFEDLKTILRNFGKGYKPVKAKTFTWEQVMKFLTTSDADIYLVHQVMLIFGIFGGLRCKEYVNLKVSEIEDTGDKIIVSITNNKNDYPRDFIIGRNYYTIVKQYMVLRPDDLESNRFFIAYKHGKCIRQAIGKNTIGGIPSIIANYLNLENPERYTGHAFRRTCATLLANTGATLAFLKSHLGWRSDSVALGYIDHSLFHRQQAFDKIADTAINNNQNYGFQGQIVHSNSAPHVSMKQTPMANSDQTKAKQNCNVSKSSSTALSCNSVKNNNPYYGNQNQENQKLQNNDRNVNNSKSYSSSNNYDPSNHQSTSKDCSGLIENQYSDELEYQDENSDNLQSNGNNIPESYANQQFNDLENNNQFCKPNNNKRRKVSEQSCNNSGSSPQNFQNCTVTIQQLIINNNYCQKQ